MTPTAEIEVMLVDAEADFPFEIANGDIKVRASRLA